jgi:hypothetical protein
MSNAPRHQEMVISIRVRGKELEKKTGFCERDSMCFLALAHGMARSHDDVITTLAQMTSGKWLYLVRVLEVKQ